MPVEPIPHRRGLLTRLAAALLLLLPVLFLAACAPPRPMPVNPADAQKMVLEVTTENHLPDTLRSYTVLGSRAGFDGHVIAFWMCRPAAPNLPAAAISGYAIVRKYEPGGQGIQFVMTRESSLPGAGEPVDFLASATEATSSEVRVVFGRVLSPDVRAVEVLYADGQSLRWPAGGEGFLLFRQEPVEWTQLNVLGEDEQLLKSYELKNDATTSSVQETDPEADCPGTAE